MTYANLTDNPTNRSDISKKKKYTLYVSYNRGKTYEAIYTTDNKDDHELLTHLSLAQQSLRNYYIEGNDEVFAITPGLVINYSLESAYPTYRRSLTVNQSLLESKFGKCKKQR